jgi:hypothetical protein
VAHLAKKMPRRSGAVAYEVSLHWSGRRILSVRKRTVHCKTRKAAREPPPSVNVAPKKKLQAHGRQKSPSNEAWDYPDAARSIRWPRKVRRANVETGLLLLAVRAVQGISSIWRMRSCINVSGL